MSAQQTSLDAWRSAAPSVAHDTVVEEYVIGSPVLPLSIGDFTLVRGPTFCENYSVRYEDDDGQSVAVRWSSRHRAYVVRADVDDYPHGFVRPDGAVGPLVTAGGTTIDHGDELSMFEATVEFLRGRVE